MNLLHSSSPFLALLAIQLLGLISAAGARLSIGSRHQMWCQGLFLVCLAIGGGSTVGSLLWVPGLWFVPATGLALMVLAVTCEFSRSPRAAAR